MPSPLLAARMLAASAVLAATLAGTAPASAANQEAQLWLALGTEAVVTGALRTQYEAQVRLGAQSDGLYQYQNRFGLAYRASRRTSLMLGGQVSNVIRDARSEPAERRVLGQIDLLLAEPPGRRLVARTRIERRYTEGSGAITWRARQRLAMDFALPNRRGTLATNFEAMFNLDDTSMGEGPALDRTRAYAGASFPIARIATCSTPGPPGSRCGPLTVRVEAGYMHQWRMVRAREDKMDHIALVALTVRP